MNPNLLSYILRKNYINYKKGKLSRSKYKISVNRSYSYLTQSSFKNKKRKSKKEILYFSRLI